METHQLVARDCYYDGYGRRRCTRWSSWGRWVVVGVAILFFLMLALSCLYVQSSSPPPRYTNRQVLTAILTAASLVAAGSAVASLSTAPAGWRPTVASLVTTSKLAPTTPAPGTTRATTRAVTRCTTTTKAPHRRAPTTSPTTRLRPTAVSSSRTATTVGSSTVCKRRRQHTSTTHMRPRQVRHRASKCTDLSDATRCTMNMVRNVTTLNGLRTRYYE